MAEWGTPKKYLKKRILGEKICAFHKYWGKYLKKNCENSIIYQYFPKNITVPVKTVKKMKKVKIFFKMPFFPKIFA